MFPNERVSNVPSCLFNATPEDHTNFDQTTAIAVLSDIQNFDNLYALFCAPDPRHADDADDARRRLVYSYRLRPVPHGVLAARQLDDRRDLTALRRPTLF